MFQNKPLNLKLRPPGKYAGWRLLSILLMGILLLAALFTYYFIYNNIYTTLADANAVIALNSQIGGETVDQVAYEKSLELLKTKETPYAIPTTTRDVFRNNIIEMYEQKASTTTSSTVSSTP